MSDTTEALLERLAGLAAERQRLTEERESVTERLQATVRALVTEHGMSELAVSRTAGISRQSVRVWVGSETRSWTDQQRSKSV